MKERGLGEFCAEVRGGARTCAALTSAQVRAKFLGPKERKPTGVKENIKSETFSIRSDLQVA